MILNSSPLKEFLMWSVTDWLNQIISLPPPNLLYFNYNVRGGEFRITSTTGQYTYLVFYLKGILNMIEFEYSRSLNNVVSFTIVLL